MSRAQHTEKVGEAARLRAVVAVVPLAIPLLACPGAISTAIIHANKDVGWMHAVLRGEIWLAALRGWPTLHAALPISHAIGTTGINIATRLMGLVLAAIAAEFIVHGLKGMWFGP